MTDGLLFALILLAALGSGLVGGVFFAFSAFVMKALGRLPPSQGIAAMKSINILVINPWFLGPFLGTAALCVVLTFATLFLGAAPTVWLLAGSLLYLIGTFAVTMLFNVPRNNVLAKADPHSTDAARLWTGYLKSWTIWNHVRTVAALAAAVAFILALR